MAVQQYAWLQNPTGAATGIITATKTADGTNRTVTATQDANGNWTMKPGYSISESVASGVSLPSPTDSTIDGSSATAAQLTEGLYPEFNH
ncbi:MAG: hypothetical protein ABF904_10355 [Ethanoligenens sp.]